MNPELHVVLVLKTSVGAAWVVPQVAEMVRRNHGVTVLLPATDGRLADALRGVGAVVLRAATNFGFAPRWSTLHGLWRLRAQLRALHPDVVHYHLYASALAARIAGLGLRHRRVHMIAGPLYLDSWVIRSLERALARLDSVVVAGSDHTAARYAELGIAPERIVSIPYGVDIEAFSPSSPSERRRAREDLGLADSTFVAVMVAYVYAPKSIVHRDLGIKGHDVLLEAWRSFHEEHPDSKLILVGSGFDVAGEQFRQELMTQFGLPGNGVTWLASVDDVRPIYAAADVSVSPSLSENHGAALEAGAAGVPSIVSDAGGLPETVTPTSGWLVPAGDSIGLHGALTEAFAARVGGGLETRRRATRMLIEERFDRTESSRRLVDVIEDAAESARSRTRGAVLVSEARLARSASGEWVSRDGVNGDHQWDRYAPLPGFTLAARVDAGPVSGGAELRVTPIRPLPTYEGLVGLVRVAVPLVSALDRVVRESGPVIVRAPGPLSLTAGAIAVLRRRGYAVELVGDPAEVLTSGAVRGMGAVAARVAAWATRALVSRAGAVRYVTNTTLQARYPPRPGTPTWAISNVRLPACARPRHGREWPTAPDVLELLAVGSHANSYKGHDVALRAVADLRASGRRVHLTIVGTGSETPRLRELAAGLGVDGDVTFAPATRRSAELVPLFERSDILLHPSRTEGLPRVVIEAMATGLPVVASRVGGLMELVSPRFAVPPDDPKALAAAVQDISSSGLSLEAESRRALQVASGYGSDELDARFAGWIAAVAEIAGG